MKAETEQVLRNIFTLDSAIPPEKVEAALAMLTPPQPDGPELLRVIRFADAMQLLGISRSSLKRMIKKGLLERVFGSSDKHGIGITADSYNRFIYEHTRSGRPEESPALISNKESRSARRETLLRKIRWSYHFTLSTTAEDKYKAIARLLSTRKDVSVSAACLAAGVKRSSYRSYIKAIASPRPLSRTKARINLAAQTIAVNYPNTASAPSLRNAEALLIRSGIRTSRRTIAKILDELGYARSKHQH